MKNRTLLAGLLIGLLVIGGAGTLSAGPHKLSGSQVKERTDQVMSTYRWINDLEELREEARKRKKLIFWMQIVGDLDGGL